MKRFIIILALVIIAVVGYSYYRFKVRRHLSSRGYVMVCRTQLSFLGRAIRIYANDHDDKFPNPAKWCDLLNKHAEVTKRGLRCYGASEGPCNYAMNKNVEKLDIRRSPSDLVVLFETHPGWNQSGGPEILTTDNHQGEGCNVLFANVNTEAVKFVKTEDLDDLKWDIENNEAEKP